MFLSNKTEECSSSSSSLLFYIKPKLLCQGDQYSANTCFGEGTKVDRKRRWKKTLVGEVILRWLLGNS